MGGDQAQRGSSDGIFSCWVHTRNIDTTGAKYNTVGDDIPKQLSNLGDDVVEVTETVHVCSTLKRFYEVIVKGKFVEM